MPSSTALRLRHIVDTSACQRAAATPLRCAARYFTRYYFSLCHKIALSRREPAGQQHASAQRHLPAAFATIHQSNVDTITFHMPLPPPLHAMFTFSACFFNVIFAAACAVLLYADYMPRHIDTLLPACRPD